jgi:hypothetical protein
MSTLPPPGTHGWAICDPEGTLMAEPIAVVVDNHYVCGEGHDHLLVSNEDIEGTIYPEDFFEDRDAALAALALAHLEAVDETLNALFPDRSKVADLLEQTEVLRAVLMGLTGDAGQA